VKTELTLPDELGDDAPIAKSTRTKVEDGWIKADLSEARLSNRLFMRLIAKKKRFSNVDFKYSIFDTCYLRDCVFDSCDFTGCRFIGSSLIESKFVGCIFDYATFERTLLEDEILASGCPGYENLKLKFARTLRMNFQQVGDVRAANKAIRIELEATETHLRKAWKSNESYYRKKYPGAQRLKMFAEWFEFKALDLVWGNGESPIKLLCAVLVLFGVMTLLDVMKFKDPWSVRSYISALLQMPQIFLGTVTPQYYSGGYLAIITFFRLVAFAFFMSIVIKRFNRR
jgi:hypothetical protein